MLSSAQALLSGMPSGKRRFTVTPENAVPNSAITGRRSGNGVALIKFMGWSAHNVKESS